MSEQGDKIAPNFPKAESQDEVKNPTKCNKSMLKDVAVGLIIVVLFLLIIRLVKHMSNPDARILGMEDKAKLSQEQIAAADKQILDSALNTNKREQALAQNPEATAESNLRTMGPASAAAGISDLQRRAAQETRMEYANQLLATADPDSSFDHGTFIQDMIVSPEQEQAHKNWAAGRKAYSATTVGALSTRDDHNTPVSWIGMRRPAATAETSPDASARVINTETNEHYNVGTRQSYMIGGTAPDLYGAERYNQKFANSKLNKKNGQQHSA